MGIEVISKAPRVRKITAYDMEWVPGSPTKDRPSKLDCVRIIGAYDEQKGYRSYFTVRDFLRGELTSENRGRWYYAHAGGMADVQFVLEAIVRINLQARRKIFEVNASFSGSSAIIVHVKYRGTKNVFHFIDSFWLLRTSLENIGKWIGLNKGAAEKRRSKEEAKHYYAHAPIAELRAYNETDCQILHKAIHEFENVLLDMGSQLQMTQASSAMQLFRRVYLKQDIPTSNRINEIARHSYTASRVEVYTRHIQNGKYFDINSSFPYAMTRPCPGQLIGVNRELGHFDTGLFIADAEIEVPDMYMPPLPYRQGSRVFFPTGRWRNWFTNIDLELLLSEGGKIHALHEVCHFAPFDDMADYARDIYKRRMASEGFEKEVYKITLNSLYGKFAESPEKQGLRIDPPPEERAQFDPEWEIMPGVWLVEHTTDVPHMHVPISTHITAFARRTLYSAMNVVWDTYYCDTDGFGTSDAVMTGGELGELKLEKLISEGIFVQAKLYRLLGTDDKGKQLDLVKAKGFSKLTASEFMGLIEGEAISYERMARIRQNFRAGNITPEEVLIEKRLKGDTLPKRFTYPDGHTRPWTIGELQSGDTLPSDLRFKFDDSVGIVAKAAGDCEANTESFGGDTTELAEASTVPAAPDEDLPF